MESAGKQRTHMGTRTIYRIVVGAELSERYAAAFEGMDMEVKNGRTILTGEVIDQPHLHGILNRISALGLDLVSIESVCGERWEEDAASYPLAGDGGAAEKRLRP
jgi:hypothetical protein